MTPSAKNKPTTKPSMTLPNSGLPRWRSWANMDRLNLNQNYSNREIVEIFKCSPQGGMRRSYTTNTLVLVSNKTGKNPYQDKWENDVLYYTGMGLTGDQSLDFAQNKTLSESQSNGIVIHLFEVTINKVYTYRGIVEYTGEYRIAQQEDSQGNLRKVYQFGLRLI